MSSSTPLSPFLNSTMPLPRLRPTSGSRLPKISNPKARMRIHSAPPGNPSAPNTPDDVNASIMMLSFAKLIDTATEDQQSESENEQPFRLTQSRQKRQRL